MIKTGQIETLIKHGYHYITAITKKQIEVLVNKDIIDYSLFDENLSEVTDNDVRYIFRRNPIRAQEIADMRASKKHSIETLVKNKNMYLSAHPKAKVKTAIAVANRKIEQLGMKDLLSVHDEGRELLLTVHEKAWSDASKLDGCYVIKTDLSHEAISSATIHSRYKDLALVESAFRTVKSDIDIRPVYVRTEESTRGHVFIAMLAYMIIRELDKLWSSLYLTVSEGLRSLSTLCITEVSVEQKKPFQQIPKPRLHNQKLLKAAGVELPKILPQSHARVVTRTNRRISACAI